MNILISPQLIKELQATIQQGRTLQDKELQKVFFWMISKTASLYLSLLADSQKLLSYSNKHNTLIDLIVKYSIIPLVDPCFPS